MKTRKPLLTLAMAGILGSSTLVLGTGSFAADTAEAANDKLATEVIADTSTKADDSSFIRTAEEAFKALQEIRAARVAIFNGNPEEAVKLSDIAQKELTAAKTSIDELALATQKSTEGGDAYIPFDTSMSLVEGFVPDESDTAALMKANEHLAKGEQSHAAQALKVAKIDVSVSAAMIPAASSLQHVDDAIKLLSEKKYYEANLALKAVEDSVLVEVYDLQAIPVQGT